MGLGLNLGPLVSEFNWCRIGDWMPNHIEFIVPTGSVFNKGFWSVLKLS